MTLLSFLASLIAFILITRSYSYALKSEFVSGRPWLNKVMRKTGKAFKLTCYAAISILFVKFLLEPFFSMTNVEFAVLGVAALLTATYFVKTEHKKFVESDLGKKTAKEMKEMKESGTAQQ